MDLKPLPPYIGYRRKDLRSISRGLGWEYVPQLGCPAGDDTEC